MHADIELSDTSRTVEIVSAEGITWDTTGTASKVAVWLGNCSEADRQKIRQAARHARKDGNALRVSFPSMMTFILGATDNAGHFGCYVPEDHES